VNSTPVSQSLTVRFRTVTFVSVDVEVVPFTSIPTVLESSMPSTVYPCPSRTTSLAVISIQVSVPLLVMLLVRLYDPELLMVVQLLTVSALAVPTRPPAADSATNASPVTASTITQRRTIRNRPTDATTSPDPEPSMLANPIPTEMSELFTFPNIYLMRYLPPT